MALILSLETATAVCSVGLHQEGKLLSMANLNQGYTHFEKLPELIAKVFQDSNLGFSDLKAVAISKGPGSYTGLRIGVSMAKGLSYALGIPIIAIETLEAMANSLKSKLSKEELLCPMIDARRQEVYCSIFNQKLEKLWPTQALIIDQFTFDQLLDKNSLILFGDGSEKFTSLFNDRKGIRFERTLPSADSVGTLAWEKFEKKEFENTSTFEPFYLKDFAPGLRKKNLTL